MSAIQGVVTTRDVLLHATLVARLFGFAFLVRCLVAAAGGKQTTFLSLLLQKERQVAHDVAPGREARLPA